jgi:uncharacterized membrane-anchored protein YhcB (DUF1043 family)
MTCVRILKNSFHLFQFRCKRIDIASISALAAIACVIIGVVLAILELRNLKRQRDTEVETRQAQLLT